MVADSSSEVTERRGAAGDAVPRDVTGMRGSGTRRKVQMDKLQALVFILRRRRCCLGFGFELLQVPHGVQVSRGEVGRVGFAPAGLGQRR